MGRHIHSRRRKTMVKTSKRQKKVERTRKIMHIRTKVKLDYKNSKCVDRVYAVLAPLLGMAHQRRKKQFNEITGENMEKMHLKRHGVRSFWRPEAFKKESGGSRKRVTEEKIEEIRIGFQRSPQK
ncbi:hypothetical protein C0J52_16462 [Blattella germanica]|nr:hypothetical protein C0J52_16462 [Blattella germanica]